MGLLHYLWSRTAASNATADAQINFAEGQAPSSVNDSCRALMASAAGFRDDISGAIVTTGTSTAYAVSSYQVFDTLAHMSGNIIAFTPHTTNGATVTLNVDGLGAKPLRSAPSTELLAGTLIQGTPYTALYNNSDAAWYLSGFYVNPYNIPLGAGLPFFGLTAPSSSFVLPFGQAISRTTYSALFSLIGGQYGVGDGSTTFNVPDLRGRVPAGKEDMGGASAFRLTSTYFGANPGTLGAAGGAESRTLVTANLPAYTPSGTIGGNVSPSQTIQIGGGAHLTPAGGGATNVPATNEQSISISSSGLTFTGTAQGGTSTPVATVQPTLICNYILRII